MAAKRQKAERRGLGIGATLHQTRRVRAAFRDEKNAGAALAIILLAFPAPRDRLRTPNVTTTRLLKLGSRLLPALLAALAGCVEDPVPRLRIGTFQRPGFEPLFLAQRLGYLSEERVQLVEFPSVAETLLAYRNHAIDAATVTSDEVLRLAAEGQSPRVVLLMDHSAGTDAVLALPAVADVAALKGQKVAVESNALGGYVLSRALATAGLTVADVHVLSGRVDRAFVELAPGGAVAAVSYEPQRSRLARRGARPIFDSSQLPGEIADVLIAPAALVEKRQPALREVTAAWFRALDYLATRGDDAVVRMAPREGLTPEQFRDALRLVTFAGLSENHRQLDGATPALAEGMRGMMDFMLKAGMLPHAVDPAELRDARALPALPR